MARDVTHALDVADDGSNFSKGRFSRLAKLASMSAKLSTDVVSRGVKKLRGDDEGSLLSAESAKKLVATLGDLKGLAMKMGQQMSMDPDMLTPEVRAVIARLQNQAPPMPWPRVREVIVSEFGQGPEALYAEFSEAPIASASLGQVHLARTHQGDKVAVKIQYPDIADALKADLDNVSTMVSMVATTTRITHGKSYFAELRESMMDELDYLHEAQRAEQYRAACAHVPGIVVPRVFTELTRKRVLTMEFLEGETFKEFLHHREGVPNDEKFRVAKLLTLALWGPFLRTGLAHSDPHPGNFILLPDGRVGVLDFGAIKQLSPRWVDVNRRLFRAVVEDRPVDMMALCVEAGFEFSDREGARPFIEEVLAIISRPLRTDDFDFGAAGMSRDLRNVVLKNAHRMVGIKPPKESVQFFRAVGGLSQNLENLGARGDYRATHHALLSEFSAD